MRQRLGTQQISAPTMKTPVEVVSWLGAIQAQDYPGALWSLGLRLPGSTVRDIERAIADRTIIRTWPMRGTLHFVAAADIRWMLELMTPKVVKGAARLYHQLGLDEGTFGRARDLFGAALRGDRQLPRSSLYILLQESGIPAVGQRGITIISRLCQEGFLCFGSHIGKEPGFALLGEWAPSTRRMTREESLAEITRRYFTGHGPATIRDFTWWTGLTVTDAKVGLEMNAAILTGENFEGKTYWINPANPEAKALDGLHLLPGFDEYLLGYADRHAALHVDHAPKIVPGNNGIFRSTIVIDGKVEGVWMRIVKRSALRVTPSPFCALSACARTLLEAKSRRYAEFLGLTLETP